MACQVASRSSIGSDSHFKYKCLQGVGGKGWGSSFQEGALHTYTLKLLQSRRGQFFFLKFFVFVSQKKKKKKRTGLRFYQFFRLNPSSHGSLKFLKCLVLGYKKIGFIINSQLTQLDRSIWSKFENHGLRSIWATNPSLWGMILIKNGSLEQSHYNHRWIKQNASIRIVPSYNKRF